MRACKEQIWFGRQIWKWGKTFLLFAERSPPEIGSVGLGDAERVPLELSARKDGFDLGQHVTEDQRELGEVSPETERATKRNVPGSVQQTDKKSAVSMHLRRDVTSLLFYWAEMLEILALELVWKLICLTHLSLKSTWKTQSDAPGLKGMQLKRCLVHYFRLHTCWVSLLLNKHLGSQLHT